METREYRGIIKSGGTIRHLSMNAKMHTFDAHYLMTGVGHELGEYVTKLVKIPHQNMLRVAIGSIRAIQGVCG
ncbi:hypothetical protein DPMN_073310 [Dreissena polymorpha]|uniref:Uncharacterized protein n=1 Tax=Dreissena polymorpha TaxID=45954 RepID=A0A9D4HD49_DREPO|nr:hypothetical protein DPMN_073310 [Dreissena polymorpha]